MRTFLIGGLMSLISTAAFAADDIAPFNSKDVHGLWVVQGGTAFVHIKDCEDMTPCGTLVHIVAKDPHTILDSQNPDPALATKPLIGSRMLWGFSEKSDKWSSGKIYDAESGKSYKAKLERNEDGTLEVKGCVGPICQKQIWTEIKLD